LVATAEAPAKTTRGIVTAISKNFETWLKEQGNGEALEKLLALQSTYRETVAKPRGYAAMSTTALSALKDNAEKRIAKWRAETASRVSKQQDRIDRINAELARR
jgi:hypothetical protein